MSSRAHRGARRVGIFDVTHLGKARVSGRRATCAVDFVNSCLTNDLRPDPARARPSTRCAATTTGGVVDDLIAYLRSDDDVFLIPNAANTAAVVELLAAAAPEGHRRSRTCTTAYGVFAVQGPRATRCSTRSACRPTTTTCPSSRPTGNGQPVIVCRTGYTGERGYELVPTWEAADAAVGRARVEAVADRSTVCRAGSARATPCAPRWATRCTATTSSPRSRRSWPASAWAVGWEKDAFWGKEALRRAARRQDLARLTRGLLATGRGIPRAHCAVLKVDGEVVGEVTSGTFSPTLKEGIALALLEPLGREGDEVVIDVRGREVPATVVKPPFVQVGVRES